MKKYWKIILAVVIVVGGICLWYGLKAYNRGPKDVSDEKVEIVKQAAELTKEYADDEAKANTAYNGKTIGVTGTVTAVETDDKGIVTITLAGDNDLSTITCTIDERHAENAKTIQSGSNIRINGFCNGAQTMLGTEVSMNRCAIINK